MKIMKTHSKYHGWSLLDPRPVFYLDETTHTELCVWNGIYMTKKQAMLIACEKYLSIWPTPTMKNRSYQEFITAYFSNAFGHREWDGIISRLNSGQDHYNLLVRMLKPHTQKMPAYSGPEVMSWFNLHKQK
jgi:hypothetical protein